MIYTMVIGLSRLLNFAGCVLLFGAPMLLAFFTADLWWLAIYVLPLCWVCGLDADEGD